MRIREAHLLFRTPSKIAIADFDNLKPAQAIRSTKKRKIDCQFVGKMASAHFQ